MVFREGPLTDGDRALIQQGWVDGYTSALANAVEHGYIDDEQYDDLYEEVLNVG